MASAALADADALPSFFGYLHSIAPIPRRLLAAIETREPTREEKQALRREILRCKREIRAAREAAVGPT